MGNAPLAGSRNGDRVSRTLPVTPKAMANTALFFQVLAKRQIDAVLKKGGPTLNQPPLKRIFTVRDVAFFTVVAVFNLRNLATAAKMGPGVIGLWLCAIVAFFVPLGLAVGELGTRDPGEGGFYRWTRTAFGDTHGFLAGWFYWVSNITYLPTLLSVIAISAAYAIGHPELENDPWYAGIVALALLGLAAWSNVRGLRSDRWVTNSGAIAAWVAVALLVAAGWIAAAHHSSATTWTWDEARAHLGDVRTFGYFGTLAFALGGLELVAVMGGEITDPKRTLPRAILLAGVAIGVLYLAGTVAVLLAVPPEKTSPIVGPLDALKAVGERAGWGFLPVVGAVLIVIAAAATLSAYLGGVARLPFAAGLDRFLPPTLGRIHPRHGTPHVAIYVQAGIAAVFILAAQVGGTVREAYLVLLDLTMILTFLPYLYIFLSVPRLRPAGPEPGVARLPGGRAGVWYVTLAGAATTVLSMAAAVIPPRDVENIFLFEAKIWGGLVLFGATGYGLFRWFKSRAPK
jgi:amino acid transporter